MIIVSGTACDVSPLITRSDHWNQQVITQIDIGRGLATRAKANDCVDAKGRATRGSIFRID